MTRRLFVGTDRGLYVGDLEGARFEAVPTGFSAPEHGPLRASVLRRRGDPGVLLAATLRSGVWRSTDEGASWDEASTGMTHREVWCLAEDPASKVLYAGTAPVVLYRSVDGGEHWEDLSSLRGIESAPEWHLHVPPFVARIRSIDLSSEGRRLVLAIEEGWLALSDDHGEHWRSLRSGLGGDCHMAITAPADPDAILAATEIGFFRSEDRGQRFAALADIELPYATHLLAAGGGNTLFAVGAERHPGHWRPGEQGAGTGVYRSDDGGRSWSRVRGGLPDYLHAGPRGAVSLPGPEPEVLIGLSDGSILRSIEAGTGFCELVDGLPPIASLALVEPAPARRLATTPGLRSAP